MENRLELHPSYGLWHKPFWQTDWFYYLLLISGGILLMLILWYATALYRARKRKNQPWRLALERLQELRPLLVCQSNAMVSKEFYIRLNIIIKNYLYARYGFNVESKTDEELIRFLESTSLNREIVQHMCNIYEDGIEAKFAQGSVLHTILERDLNYSIDIIKKTIPRA